MAARTRSQAEPTDTGLPPATLTRRVLWVGAAAVWLFVAIALVSFSTADAPSHVVAVTNDPPANLCGRAGAALAYWSYYVFGIGTWIIMAGAAGWLFVTASGRAVDHPVVRAFGLVLTAAALACLHGMIAATWPAAGIMAGAEAGLLAVFALGELIPRFSVVGTLLILILTTLVGAILAAERLVIAIPALIGRAIARAWTIKWPRVPLPRIPSPAGLREHLGRRPEQALGIAGGGAAATRRQRRSGKDDGSINADAGGVGATESFDPDDYAGSDEDWDGEYDDEYEYEYEYEDEEDDEADDAQAAAPARNRLSTEELKAKISKLPVRMASQNKSVARDEDIPRQPPEAKFEGYQFPTLDLLEDPEHNVSEKIEQLVREQARVLEEALQQFSIDGEVVGIESGPVVTQYSVQLAPGTKVAKVNAVSSDIARALKAQNIRVVPTMPGRTTIGIEVPNLQKEKVRLKELMSSGASEGMTLPMFLGKDVAGEPLVSDLTRMPHMLIAGTTGSGKSVCMNTIIMSWLYTKRPDELKLVLVDPKMVEMSQFQDIPHLMCPVVTEMSKAAAILEWAVKKMEERYELLKEAMVRDVAAYNELGEEELYERFEPENDVERARIPKKLPYMVFIIDELADLIMTHKEVEQHIVRIAQKARAVGIHLILATQRPQANVVTGLIKSNMPCRVSFKVASGMDSRIVLDHKGAELLLGQGDMMVLPPHTSELQRAQGTLVTDIETRRVAKFLKTIAEPSFERSLLAIRPAGEQEEEVDNPAERDPLFDNAVEIMIETGRGSVSLLQRRLAIGYSRASRLVDQMAMAGILGDHKGSVAREVMISAEEWEQMKALEAEQSADGTLWSESSTNGAAADDEESAEAAPFPTDDDGRPLEDPDHAAANVAPAADAPDADDESDDSDVDDEVDDADDADEEADDEEYEYEYVDEDDDAGDDGDEYEYEYEYVDEDDDDGEADADETDEPDDPVVRTVNNRGSVSSE